jgi:hypothetical protein
LLDRRLAQRRGDDGDCPNDHVDTVGRTNTYPSRAVALGRPLQMCRGKKTPTAAPRITEPVTDDTGFAGCASLGRPIPLTVVPQAYGVLLRLDDYRSGAPVQNSAWTVGESHRADNRGGVMRA